MILKCKGRHVRDFCNRILPIWQCNRIKGNLNLLYCQYTYKNWIELLQTLVSNVPNNCNSLFICQYALEIKSTWFTEPNNVGSGSFPSCLLNVTACNGVLLYKFIKKMAGRATWGCLAFLFFWYLLDPHVIVQYIPETSETTECFTNQKLICIPLSFQ